MNIDYRDTFEMLRGASACLPDNGDSEEPDFDESKRV